MIEINLIIFIPILAKNFSVPNRETAIKYFIPQTFGSIFILASILIRKNNPINPISIILGFSLGIFIKLALFPFHIWIINVIEKIKYHIIILLITWQKIIPLILIKLSNKLFMYLIIMLSLGISRILAFYQNSIRKLLTYSSIINT